MKYLQLFTGPHRLVHVIALHVFQQCDTMSSFEVVSLDCLAVSWYLHTHLVVLMLNELFSL